MKQNINRFDQAQIYGDAKITDEGYIRANAIVTRPGIFLYKNADGSIRKELRHPDDVWDKTSIESMKMIPVTNDHPTQKLVNSENSKFLAIGYTGEKVEKKASCVLANFVITDKSGVDAVVKHGRKELSLGYTVDLDETPGIYEGEHYDARQKNIRYNHLAIVDKARAGEMARIILDSDDAFEVKEEEIMVQRKIKIDNKEVMVDESTADYIDRLVEDLRNLTDERNRVEAEISMIKDKLEKAEAERDLSRDELKGAEERLKEINADSSKFKKAVSQRVKLHKHAESCLSSSQLEKLDSMDDQQIKKLIIETKRPTIVLDGKSSMYVEAMFDTIIDEQCSKSVNISNVITSKGVKSDSKVDTMSARQKMMDNMQNASKKGVKTHE